MNGHCYDCKHPSHAGRGCPECGCVRYTDRRALREARQRTWIATAAFFVRNRWIEQEVRVKAMGWAGAAAKALREAKRLALKPRTRVAQLRVTLIRVPQSRKEAR